MATSKSTRTNRICVVCSTAFYTSPVTISRGGGKFCSKKCRFSMTKFVEKTCEFCKKKITILASNATKGYGRFCSMICRRNWNTAPLEKRLNRFINGKDKNGCMPWNAGVNSAGYGHISVRTNNMKKTAYAHRVAWELANGPIPDGLEIRHTCDNPWCVNPDHLIAGTHQENINDAVSRGRNVKGELVGTSKLSNKKIIKIRFLHAERKLSPSKIAIKFGISRQQVYRIVTNKAWKHI